MMTAAPAYDWSHFDVHMDIRTAPARAYDAWATGAGMASFFAKSFTYRGVDDRPRDPARRGEVDDAYHLAFHHPSELTGRVLLADAPRQFAFSFGSTMRVDVFIEPRGDGTRVRLVQSSIPTDEAGRVDMHLNCRSCWVYYLLNLKSVLEHGIDLRDDGLPDNIISVHFGEHAQAESTPGRT